jgi:hypothetical protein
MSRSISMTVPHDLGTTEAKKRIAERFDVLKREYVDKIGQAEVVWVGDTASLRVAALGQTVTAVIDVRPAEVKIEVELPWLLAAMATKVQSLVKSNADDVLRIGTTKKV